MARAIDKRIMLDLIIEAKKTDQETGPFSEWLAEHLVDHLPTIIQQNGPLSVLVNDEPDREYIDYICPRCKSIISQRRRGQRMETVYKCKFHDNCGQRVDWSNPQLYRRLPEGEA